MTNRHIVLILVVALGLLLVACGSDSDDVPSLKDLEGAQPVEPATGPVDAADSVRDAEAAMMALTQCLRKQGIEVYDPVVDADGNVEKPQLAEGVDPKGKDVGEAWELCAEYLEGVTFGKERDDNSDLVDQLYKLSTCLRDKGYDVDDPTAEALDQWKGSLTDAIDFDDPEASADYEECSNDAGMGAGGK